MVELRRFFSKRTGIEHAVMPILNGDTELIPKVEEKFKLALSQSDGKAAVIVHPFFLENDRYAGMSVGRKGSENDEDYIQYQDRLRSTVTRYRDLELPILLFEANRSIATIPSTVDRMGIKGSDIFVVPTDNLDPEPIDTDFPHLAKQLRTIGLERATVVGSYLWLNKNPFPSKDEHPLAQKFILGGCVGRTIDELSAEGIKATPGLPTYPSRRKEPDWES
jgi:hypothetical protein